MQKSDTAIILTSHAEKMRGMVVIGSGGWLPPGEREALDWMSLIAMLGWNVQLQDPKDLESVDLEKQLVKWIILTGDPDEIDDRTWEKLLAIINNKPILFLTRAGEINGWLASHLGIHLSEKKSNNGYLEYNREGFYKKWKLNNHLQFRGLEISGNSDKLVSLVETCIAASVRQSNGKILLLSFHPGIARDIESTFSALLKWLLIMENPNPVAWFDWENTLILRMDDPGSAQAVHDDSFHNTKLGEKEWELIGEELDKRNARMSVAYVPAWVDDGDSSRGQLEIDGQPPSRSPGNIHRSPSVKYIKKNLNDEYMVFDYTAEYRGIQKLIEKGLATVELHGYTHMHPDREAWLTAADKYESKKWYREFGRSTINFIKNLPREEHPLYAGINAFYENFQHEPSTLICPGEEFTNEVLERAMDAGLGLVSSYYLGMRIGQQLCWNYYVCSPYLDAADPVWFNSELPVVGYFHDFDISIQGINWFIQQLDNWQIAGAKFFIDFRNVSNILNHAISINEKTDYVKLELISANSKPAIEQVRMGLHIPSKKSISYLTLTNQKTLSISFSELGTMNLANEF